MAGAAAMESRDQKDRDLGEKNAAVAEEKMSREGQGRRSVRS